MQRIAIPASEQIGLKFDHDWRYGQEPALKVEEIGLTEKMKQMPYSSAESTYAKPFSRFTTAQSFQK